MRLNVHQHILLLSVLVYSDLCFKCSFDSSCECVLNTTTNLMSAKCSDRGLLALPNFGNISHLLDSFDGSHNKIECIPNYIFGNAKSVIKLDLSYNNISLILPESFNGLEQLVTLDLEWNNVLYDVKFIHPNCFKNTPQLRYLNLKNNVGFYPSAQKYPNLSSLAELETLKLDGLPHDSFQRGYEKLSKLADLDLSSKDCDIGIIDSKFFQSLLNLQYIDISNCSVVKVWKNCLRHLKNLTHLNVSYNEKLNFAGVENITYDLQFTSIEVLKFNKVHKTFEMNTEIGRKTLKYLQNTNLKEMYMDSNRLQYVKSGVISILPKTLDRLSMADNMLSFGTYILEGKNMNISFMNVSFQFTSHTPSLGSFESINRYISQHRTHRIKRDVGINFPLPFPKNIRELHFRRSQLQFDIPRLELMENKLEYFDVSLNLLANWWGPTVNFIHLKFLNLSSNYCSNISSYFFKGTTKLETLYIQNNLLGFNIPSDVKGEILKPLQHLKTIDLSQNRIPELPSLFFIFLKQLEILNLRDNLIEDIDFKLIQMKNLSHVDLSKNRIQLLGSAAINNLESLADDRKFSLNLKGNPFVCSCASLKFLKWISQTKILLLDRRKYECKYENGTKASLANVNNIINKLEKDCSSYPGVIIGITGTIFLSVSIILFGLFYRYRWNLRYLYYMTKNRFRGYVPVIENSNKSYLYDAFISYAEQDGNFVHHDVIDNLEKEGNLKLCVHRRDFLPGNEISANITSAIHNSRKTVIILTRHYLNSQWCMFEFNMARMESMYSREIGKTLFLVFLTSILPKELPLVLMEYIHSNSYIEYPGDEYGNVVFWQKMKEAVRA
ncbi:toll-like receptor 4 [Mytilus californianus]|uniref:toll-like receptor 4 n=1 Tax=Mytilus californianus TaxID=6549 RepID=UPI002246299A|nr:toll-like receptor 4 [Mytilus californianus]